MRSASCASCGFEVEALSMSATIWANRVWSPVCFTRMITAADKLWLPAITSPPSLRGKGRDSPVNSDSSARVLPCKMTPSAGKASPGNTRITSPALSRRTATRSKTPSAPRRSTLSGSRFIRASSAPAVRSRRRNSSQRPVSKKNTNMVKESKYTSAPKIPAGSKVPKELTIKVMAMPSATGKSMLMRRWRRSRRAFLKKGVHENSKTGSESTQEAQRSNCAMSGARSPGSAT